MAALHKVKLMYIDVILEKMYTCHQTEAQAPLCEATFEKEIETALKKTCDNGNSFCQFDLEMSLTCPSNYFRMVLQ